MKMRLTIFDWSNRTLGAAATWAKCMGSGATASEQYSCKCRTAPTPKRVCLFGRHNSSGGATFVAMMKTTDIRERNNLAAILWGEAEDNPCLGRDAF